MQTTVHVSHEFDMLTEDGCLIIEGISFTGTICGEWNPAEPDVGISQGWFEDIEHEDDIQICVTRPNPEARLSFYKGESVYISIPHDLLPYFRRWLFSSAMQEHVQEWLRVERHDEASYDDREYDEWRDRELMQ